jgi:hypothetical protein
MLEDLTYARKEDAYVIVEANVRDRGGARPRQLLEISERDPDLAARPDPGR